jgi:Beta-lactamase enzyme family
MDISGAARDRRTGASAFCGTAPSTVTASVVKMDILVTLALRAPLTGDTWAMAERMIRTSDNDATTPLWHQIGGAAGLAATYRALGLVRTVPDPARGWGATRTDPADRLRVLEALCSPASPLDATRRAAALELLASVDPSQAWGVRAAAAPGERVALKNGWLARTVDGGTWTVNSVGRITGPGRDLLVAVLSRGHATLPAGIAAVERAAIRLEEALARGQAAIGTRRGRTGRDAGSGSTTASAGEDADSA